MFNSTSTDHINFPRYHNIIQLRSLGHGYYGLLDEFLRQAWSADLDLIGNPTLAAHQSQATFLGDVKSYTHIWFARRRYGAGTLYRWTHICTNWLYFQLEAPIMHSTLNLNVDNRNHPDSAGSKPKALRELSSLVHYGTYWISKIFFKLIFFNGRGPGGRCLGCRGFSSTRLSQTIWNINR